jgi:hypothetical protein
MTDSAPPSRPVGMILGLFWGSILINLGLPWGLLALFEVSAHRRTLSEAWRYLRLHLFAPGYDYFLMGVLSAVPFVVLAVFLLFHLRSNDRLSHGQFSRRVAGVVGSLILLFGINFWTHLSALMYPNAQGALVYFFLPYVQLILIPLGYGIGRLTWAFIHLIRGSGEEPA